MSTTTRSAKLEWYYSLSFIAPTLIAAVVFMSVLVSQYDQSYVHFTPIYFSGTVKELAGGPIVNNARIKKIALTGTAPTISSTALNGNFSVAFSGVDFTNSYSVVIMPPTGINTLGTEVILLERPRSVSGYPSLLGRVDPAAPRVDTLKVTLKEAGQARVGETVSLTLNGAAPANSLQTTNASGMATFIGLEQNASYTITWNGNKTLTFSTANLPTTATIKGTFAW